MTTTFIRGENPLKADKLNTAFSERVSRGGDTMQGMLTLAGDPVAIFDAATKQYVDARVNGVPGPQGVQGPPAGRNLIHNPLFNIAQRGAGPFTVNGGYTSDRWLLGAVLDVVNMSVANLIDADRSVIGDEAATKCLRNTFTGNAGATANHYIEQRIEGVRRLSGKTVIVSFWAAGSAGQKLGINAYQIFGTGGSPSTFVQALPTGIAITLSLTWTRYSVQIALPSTSGKTLGTNGDDATWLRINYSAGATPNQEAGNIGVQSGTINIWGVQLEIGSVATPLEKPDPGYDLSNCLRFYETGYIINGSYAAAVNSGLLASSVFAVTKRAVPVVTIMNNVSNNVTGATLGGNSNMVFCNATAPAVGNYTMNLVYTASADL